MRRVVAVLVLAGLLVGCGVGKTYKRALDAEARGDVLGAAARYLDVLDRKASHEDAREGLRRVAHDAWHARYAPAAEAERAMRFEVARDSYRDLVRLEDRLGRHGALDFDRGGVDAREKVARMSQGAAQKAYALAEDARRSGRFEEAVVHYASALGFVPDYLDAREKVGVTWLEWGDAEVEGGSYRDAILRYDVAAREGAVAGRERSAEVLVALGRHHLAAETCQQAVRDLSAASERVPRAGDGWLDAARACAEVRVSARVASLGRRDLGRFGGFDPGPRLEVALNDRVGAMAPEQVAMLPPSVLRGSTRRPDGSWVVHRLIEGRVLDGELLSMAPREQERIVTAEREVACEAEEQRPPCYAPVDLRVVEVSAASDARLSVSIGVVDVAIERVTATRTFDTSARDEVTWIAEVRDVVTDARLGADATGYRIPAEVVAGMTARRDLEPSSALWARAVDQLVEDGAAWLATRLVPEERAVDPSALTITPLAAIAPPAP